MRTWQCVCELERRFNSMVHNIPNHEHVVPFTFIVSSDYRLLGDRLFKITSIIIILMVKYLSQLGYKLKPTKHEIFFLRNCV